MTTKGASLMPGERQWLHDVSAEFRHQGAVIVHIGVEYGASLHCCKAGCPDARVVGVDLDISKCIEPHGFELLEGDSKDVAQTFHDRIDFLFVDGGHTFEDVWADMSEWLGKVRPGGCVAFHDYGNAEEFPHTAGVSEAVDAWDWAPTTWAPELGLIGSIRAYWRLPYLRRGQEFGTVGIGVPYYKSEYEFFRWWTWLIVGGLEDNDKILNNSRLTCGVPIPLAHNGLVAEFLRTDRDTLCIVEDDHVGPQDVIRRMREKEENWQFDIVCASYPNRRDGRMVMGWNFADNGKPNEYGEYGCRLEPMKVMRSGTQEVDGAAVGCVLIRRWLLDAMRGNKLPDEAFWFEWRGRNSQDIQFYGKAHRLGARVGVDRDNDIGHIGRHIYTMKQFYESRDKYLKEQEGQNG